MTTYIFDHFAVDGLTVPGNPITVTMDKDHQVVANYLEANQMGTVAFTGTVSSQAAAGRAIVITVTKPGGGTATVNTVTLADRTYSATYTDIAGSYSAVAKGLADTQYAECVSPAVPFTIALLPSTITLAVS